MMIVLVLALTAFAVGLTACGKKAPAVDGTIFTLDKTHVDFVVGDADTITLNVSGVNDDLEWATSDPEVVSITSGSSANKINIKAEAKGQAVISVTAGENIAVCTVNVKPLPRLEMLTTSMSLWSGDEPQKIGIDTDSETVEYTSSNKSVATVNKDGMVQGVGGGTCRITVSVGNGVSASCNVVVTDPYVQLSSELESLLTDDTVVLTASSNGAVEWGVDNPSIAQISADSGESITVTALQKGSTTVWASFKWFVAECEIKVKDELLTVSLDKTTHEMELEETVDLVATVATKDGPNKTGDDAKVTWSVVSGGTYVSVDQNGRVTASDKKYGKAVVRATSVLDPDFHADCEITVLDPMRDWLRISSAEDFANAFKEGNENKSMYLTCDIDMKGATVSSNMTTKYSGTFDGRGYTVSNFECGMLFRGVTADGKIKQLGLTCTTSGLAANQGIFGEEMLGTIENCRLDVTFNAMPWLSPIARNGAATSNVTNTIITIANPANQDWCNAGFAQGNSGTWQNVYYTVTEGTLVDPNGPTQKSMDDLKAASTYTAFDPNIWKITDGSIPVLYNADNAVIKVTMSMTSATVHAGDSITLEAVVGPSVIVDDQSVTWHSSDTSVATVDSDGVVTTLKNGSVTITARSVKDSTKTATCEITVDAANTVTVTSGTTVKLELNGIKQITVDVRDGGVTYESSNGGIAQVSASGLITANAVGTVTITVTSVVSPTQSATITVNVMPEVEMSLTGESNVELEIDAQHEVDYTTNRADDVIVWTTTNSSVATVSGGVITAVAAGDAVITATSGVDGSKSFSVNVTVMPEITLSVVENLSIKPDADPTPLNPAISRGDVTYESSDDSTVTVDSDGNIVGLKEGTADITVTSVIDPSKTAVCHVTVAENITITITLDKNALALDWGEESTLFATVNVPGVRWESSEPTVATVDQTGKVTALKKNGTTTITVTSTASEEDGDVKTATCLVTVAFIDPVITVTAPTQDVELEISGTVTVVYSSTKGDAVVVTDDTTGVVSIVGDTITAVKAGTVTIKVKSNHADLGGREIAESFELTVLAAPTVTITNGTSLTGGKLIINTAFKFEAESNRADGTITWSSSDAGVATIDAEGNVTTVATGNTTITATVTTPLGATASDTFALTVVNKPAMDVSNLLYQQEAYAVNNLCIKLDCDAELGNQIPNKKTSVEITASIDGGEPVKVTAIHEVYGNAPKYVKFQSPASYDEHDIEFTLYYKNADGKIIAEGTFTKSAPTSIKLSDNLTIELGDGNAATTLEVSVTGTGKAANALADVAWTLTGGAGVSIPANAKGASVTVTATAATQEGATIKLTATLMLDKTYTAECVIKVVEHGGNTAEKLTATFVRKYSENYALFKLNKTLNKGSDFDTYKVNGTSVTQHYVADPAPTYQFFVGASNYATGSKVKIEFFKGVELVYWFECEVGAQT